MHFSFRIIRDKPLRHYISPTLSASHNSWVDVMTVSQDLLQLASYSIPLFSLRWNLILKWTTSILNKHWLQWITRYEAVVTNDTGHYWLAWRKVKAQQLSGMYRGGQPLPSVIISQFDTENIKLHCAKIKTARGVCGASGKINLRKISSC